MERILPEEIKEGDALVRLDGSINIVGGPAVKYPNRSEEGVMRVGRKCYFLDPNTGGLGYCGWEEDASFIRGDGLVEKLSVEEVLEILEERERQITQKAQWQKQILLDFLSKMS